MVQAEAQQAFHVGGRVVRHIAVTDIRFNQDELFRTGQDVIFIAQQDNRTILVDDIRQFLRVAEWAVVVRMTDGFRFVLSYLHIKVYDIVWYGHRMFTTLKSFALYVFMLSLAQGILKNNVSVHIK